MKPMAMERIGDIITRLDLPAMCGATDEERLAALAYLTAWGKSVRDELRERNRTTPDSQGLLRFRCVVRALQGRDAEGRPIRIQSSLGGHGE